MSEKFTTLDNIEKATAEAPAPAGTSWVYEPIKNRVRLFVDHKMEFIGSVDSNGSWELFPDNTPEIMLKPDTVPGLRAKGKSVSQIQGMKQLVNTITMLLEAIDDTEKTRDN